MEDHKATPNSKDLTGQVKLIDPTPVFVGNYSWVFRGKLGNRIVGVKVIQATGSTESTKRKVLREHLVWETLDDPHILEFLGYANDTGFNKFGAFISPWCSNGNVTQFLSDHGDALAPFEKIALWKGVVKGVAYLHGRVPPIIHGDLKPGNILIGDDGKPKLCDFGLVRIFLEESQSGLTTTSAHTGTERYLAPELVTYDEEDEAGHIVPTLESDIYALGCVGMVIIYGQQPFNKRKNNLQGRLISDIKKGLPPFPRSAARILFIEYPWDLLSECWCWNPHSRPTASRLLEARLFILRLTATPLARILRLSAQSYIEMENQDGGAQWRQQAGYLANMCLVSRPWCAHAIPLLLWYLGADGSSIVDMDNPVHTPWEDFIIDYARTVKGSAYRRQHRSSEVKSRSPETYVSGIVDRPQNQSKHSIGYEHLATALESVIPPMPSTVAAMRTEIQENSTQSLKFLASDGGGVPTRSLDSIQWTNEPSEYLGTFADTLSHIHTALSPQLSTRHTPRTGPLPETAVDEGRMDLETTRPSPPILPARRTPFRGFTATSVDENSDNEWDRTANHQPHTRHHPYQPHHPTHKRPQLSISPSYSRRSPTHSAYSQSYDDTRAFVPASASSGASANASADEGPNSNSYYDGNFPVASPSTTPSIFTFIRGGKRNSHHNYGMPDGPSPAGRPGVSAGNGGGGQSTAQLSLESLPSYPPDQKPPFSYPLLIRLAILGSPQKRLLSSQIFSAIEDKFPWYRDSAPTNWKSSVRHCLSLNKEFIRTQRALEDPGVGHGGWWSVDEGMKGFKRPRKRRPAQPRRSEHELDPIPITETSAATRLAIRRRHSTTFEDSLTADSSMLPPLHIPKPTHPLPTPPFSSSKFVSGRLRSGTEGDGRVRRKYPHGYSISGSYARPGGTHPPNASPSPSYSAYGYCSESSVSSCSRPNPMSISSLLNDRGPSNVAAAIAERLDKMDIDMDEPRRISIQPKIEYDVEILHEKEKAVFSSEQTLRPASPSDIPPQSHIRGSASPSHDEHTVLTRRTTPLHFVATSSPSKGSTATREREKKSTGGERSAKSTRSARASKSWASSMDLSVMEPEYESESE